MPARARLRRDPARREHARHGRARDRDLHPRAASEAAHTPIIFLTAYVEEMHTAQGYSLGAVDYMLTPVVPDGAAQQGQGLRRSLPDDAPGRAPGGPAHRVRARAGGARRGRGIGPPPRLSHQGERHPRKLARCRGEHARHGALRRPLSGGPGRCSPCSSEHVPAAHAEIAWAAPATRPATAQTVAQLDDAAIAPAMQDALASGNPVDVRPGDEAAARWPSPG